MVSGYDAYHFVETVKPAAVGTAYQGADAISRYDGREERLAAVNQSKEEMEAEKKAGYSKHAFNQCVAMVTRRCKRTTRPHACLVLPHAWWQSSPPSGVLSLSHSLASAPPASCLPLPLGLCVASGRACNCRLWKHTVHTEGVRSQAPAAKPIFFLFFDRIGVLTMSRVIHVFGHSRRELLTDIPPPLSEPN